MKTKIISIGSTRDSPEWIDRVRGSRERTKLMAGSENKQKETNEPSVRKGK